MTYNFDDLIERSLAAQGVTARIFGLEEGVRLPPESLVRDSVCVLKLHGNNHALLLDERVDHPLTEGYKKRFDELVGEEPLLLIVGCSGGDMRVRDLFRHVTSQRLAPDGAPITPGGAIWLHFESDCPCVDEVLREREDLKFMGGKSSEVRAVRTNNPGADLMHIYTALRRPPSGGGVGSLSVATVPAVTDPRDESRRIAHHWRRETRSGT